MSIEVQCPACSRTYRTPEQFGGRQVKCNACGTTMTVPQPPPAAAPRPPMMPPPLPAGYVAPLAGLAQPYPPYPPTTPPRNSHTVGIVVACIVGGVLLLLGFGGWGFYSLVKRVGGPAFAMSDATVSSKVVGVWTGTQAHAGRAPIWAELTFNSDGTGKFRFSGQGKVADADTTWQVSNHMVRLTFARIRVGNASSIGTSFLIGRVTDIGPTRLVMSTKYGNESYVRATRGGAQPPGSFPPIPVRTTFKTPPGGQPSFAGGSSPPPPSMPAPTVTPAAPAVPAGQWQDLLANLNAGTAGIAGDWKQDAEGSLSGTSERGYAKLGLTPPPGKSYEIEFTFDREAGSKEFCILFPVAGTPAELAIGSLNGQWGSIRGGTTVHSNPGRIVNGKDQTFQLTVQPQGPNVTLRGTLDGEPFITWTGPISRLRVSPTYAMSDPATLGLAIHQGVSVRFKRIRVRPLQET